MSVVDGMCRQSVRGKVACEDCAVERVNGAGSGLLGQVMKWNKLYVPSEIRL